MSEGGFVPAQAAGSPPLFTDEDEDGAGYTAKGVDLHLESDLDINNSIKHVGILGSVQDGLDFKMTDLDALGRTETVGDVFAFMDKRVVSSAPQQSVGAASEPVTTTNPTAPTSVQSAPSAGFMKVPHFPAQTSPSLLADGGDSDEGDSYSTKVAECWAAISGVVPGLRSEDELVRALERKFAAVNLGGSSSADSGSADSSRSM